MKKSILTILTILLALMLMSCIDDPEPEEIIILLNPGNDTIELNDTWTDQGVSLTQGDTELTFYSNTTLDNTSLGTTTIEYSFTYDGTTYTVERYVSITDQTKPILTLLPGIDTVSVGSVWTDASCSVTDNSGEVLTCTTTDTIDTSTKGDYLITYYATDSSGNIGMIHRIVHVVE